MKSKSLLKIHFAACVLIIFLNAAAQEPPSIYPKPIVPNYKGGGQRLPAGVPKVVDTNGNVVFVNTMFTTPSYQKAAYKLVLKEANEVARELQLPEKLPITESNVAEFYISPFGFAYGYEKIGNITTKHYMYGIEQGDKFSDLSVANYNQTCLEYKKQLLPIEQMNTNAAYQMATQWLSEASMDIKALNQDCQIRIEVNKFWNGLASGQKLTGRQFVPIYDVWWLSSKDKSEGGDTAYVQLFAPTKTLLQLAVRDPKYILRKPLT
ncbi:MAG: hypothetical protein ACREDS_09725, partial [Limisphaerales bacterium]